MISRRYFPHIIGYHYNKMCKTRLKVTKIYLKFKRPFTTVESFSVSLSRVEQNRES